MPAINLHAGDLYYPKEAAKLLGIGYATLYRSIRDGKLTPFRILHHTYIPKSEVERLLKKAPK